MDFAIFIRKSGVDIRPVLDPRENTAEVHPSMLRSQRDNAFSSRPILGLAFLFLLALWGCGGGSSGPDGGGTAQGGGGSGADYSNVQVELYQEVPVVEITGGNTGTGSILYFNPKSDRSAELYVSDPTSGVADTPINEFQSIVNAANRMFDAEMAACAGLNNPDPPPNPPVMITHLQPDTMPNSAIGGTQYLQLVMPFDVDPDSIFDNSPWNVGTDYLTGSITIFTDKSEHVNCTVLLNGKDAFGVDGYFDANNPPPGITIAPNVIIFIAQPEVDRHDGALPAVNTALTGSVLDPSNWDADVNEIRLRVGTLRDVFGTSVDINAAYYIAKDGFDKDQVRPNLSPADIISWDVIGQDPDEDWPNNNIVTRNPRFILQFNKPVIPETVGRSIVFDRPPFNGNTKVIPNALLDYLPWPTLCDGVSTPQPRPLATNVSVIVYYVDSTDRKSVV